MRKALALLLILGGGAGTAIYLATQPARTLPPVQPSAAAARAAEARVVSAFKRAGIRAAITRTPQHAQVELSDLELTSLVAEHLDASAPLQQVVLHGDGQGLLEAAGQAQVGGFAFPFFATGTVSFSSGGAAQVTVAEAELGRLPMPTPLVGSLQQLLAERLRLDLPAGIEGVTLQAVGGGAVVAGTATPAAVANLVP